MFQFKSLDRIDRRIRERVERIAQTALTHNEFGIVAMLERATEDALMLGRLRDRDVAALERLEDTFNHDFYRTQRGRNERQHNPAYA